MKRIFLIIPLLLMSLLGFNQNRMQVSITEASSVARKALKLNSDRHFSNHSEIVDVIPRYYGNNTALYEFIFSKGESVIISGSKSARPILAISHHSNGEATLTNLENLPGGYKYFIEKMYQEICHCFDTTIPENRGWHDYLQLADSTIFFNRDTSDYMIKTRWRQSGGNRNCSCNSDGGLEEVYNKYTPLSNGDCDECDGVDRHYPTGCTVTALGQIMNYWQYPILILGDKQIDWCNMPDTVNCLVATTEEKEAVAQLMRILCEELGTTYGSLRNNTNHCYGYLDPPTTTQKLCNYFGYSDDIECIYRAWYIGSWESTIKNEIQAKRPVLYWALEDNPLIGAHTFVCDGYDAVNDLFHFNWGHGEGGTWVPIDNIVEGYHQHWTRYESAMIKIKPAMLLDICNINLPLEIFYNAYYMEYIQNYNSNSPLNPTPSLLTPNTATVLISASPTSRFEFRTIPTGSAAAYRAHEEIILRDGFTVERGAEFTAQIVPCANCGDDRNMPPTIDDFMEEDDTPDQEYFGEQSEESAKAIPRPDVIYPNPTDGEFTLTVDGEVQSIIIYNAMGYPVGGWKLRATTSDHVTLDVSPLPNGTYLLRIATPQGISTKKLVVSH